jgi:hypothetical protein
MKKSKRKKQSDDGLPIDAKEWTRADWQDLHEAIEGVKRKVAKRHADRKPSVLGERRPDLPRRSGRG